MKTILSLGRSIYLLFDQFQMVLSIEGLGTLASAQPSISCYLVNSDSGPYCCTGLAHHINHQQPNGFQFKIRLIIVPMAKELLLHECGFQTDQLSFFFKQPWEPFVMCALVDGTAGCRDQSDLSVQDEVGTKAVRLFCGNVGVCGGGGGGEASSGNCGERQEPTITLSECITSS